MKKKPLICTACWSILRIAWWEYLTQYCGKRERGMSLFGDAWEEAEVTPVETELKPENPCILVYGRDPQERRCRDCLHLLELDYHNKTYLKCDLRKLTHGAGSDHRAKWDACRRFEERKE